MRHPGQVYGHSKVRKRGKLDNASAATAPGQKHFYRPVWSFSKWDEFVETRTIGRLIQVCTGASRLGEVRVDLDRSAPAVNVVSDFRQLPFRDSSSDMAACDPPYEIQYPHRIGLQRELARVSRKRVLLKAPWIMRARGWWLIETVLLAAHTCANVAVLSVLDCSAKELSLIGE